MPFSSRAVMLLTLFACLTQSQPINGNAETTTESRGGGGGGEADSSNRHYTGRHWTTSLRGPYKKIVSGGDGGRSPRFDASSDDDDDDVTEHEQKRQHRLDSSNSSFVQNTTHDSSAQRVNATKLETVRSRNHRNLASRRSSSYHFVDSTARSTAASNKKRRRPSHYSVATSTAAPSQTMPHAWYSYFRPLEQDLPEDDILPFLDFGRKLSPSLPTPPSGINSIENNKSAGTRSKSKDLHSSNVNINSTPVDEDVLPEDMDVTYVKKAVERNSAPRVTIQTHTPSISNYYRRRHPAALSRTAENLVGTSSDCSSSPSPDRNNSTKTGNQRKTNRQHSNGQTETESGEQSSKCDTSNFEKEVHNSSASLPEKSHRVAENFTVAESSLVNSVKQFETVNLNTTNATNRNITNNVKQNSTTSGRRPGGHPTTAAALRSNKTETNVTAQADNAKTASTSSPNPQLTTRILSTAVVTSVSLKESSFNNSDSPVTAPPSPQSPLPTRLARVVNSTIDTSQVGNSTGDRKNKRPEVHVSGKQSISNFNDTAEQPDRSNSTLVVDTYDKMSASNTTSRETAPPTGSAQTINRSNNTSTVEKTGKQLTNNFNSSGSENRTEQREANRHNSSRNSSNSTSSGSEIRVEPLQVNRGRQTASTVTLSSESGTRTEPPQANQTSRAEKNGKQLVTISNLTTSSDSVVPTESTRPTHTSQTESGYKNLTSDGEIPVVPSPTTGQSNRTTLTTEKSGSNVTADLTPVGKVSFIPVQLTPESTHRSENDGNVSNVTNIDDSVDPLLSSILETTTMTLLQVPALTPVTNDTSLQTNDTKEFPSVTDLPKTDLEIHEERVPGTTGAGNSPSLDEVVANATTTDGSAYVDNNTIADLVPTDVYYDYDEGGLDPLSQPGDKNGTILVVPEEDVDSWLQNSTVIEQNVEVAYPQPTFESSTYILVGLSIIPILLGAVVAARFFLLRNKKKVLDESEYSSEYNRSPLSISNASPLPTKLPRVPHHLGWEMEKSPPSLSPSLPSSKWEFPREKLRLQTVLGQGNFGQVWKAEADDISGHEGLTRLVAVKTVKESASAREREDLLRELGIMQDLGSHPNVVTLLGCCTEKEPYYLIMEYVMYGKLLTFLRDHRTRAHYYNFSDVTDALTSRDLTVFMYCVARGMDYLSNKGIIHRDLAARNVLVDHNKLCKIADFGMSRNVRDTGQIYEQRQSKGALPIRWMAPESLHFSLFTHKSDVWSFGILLWEIITLGSTPYATMGAREVMRRVRDGYRLERPSHCRPELFRVISRCWHADSNKRPNFAELKHEIGQLLSDMERGGNYIDLDSLHEEMKQSSQGSTLQRNQ